jgi:hypothetical protein
MIGKWLELRWMEKSFSSKLKKKTVKFIEYGIRVQDISEEIIVPSFWSWESGFG